MSIVQQVRDNLAADATLAALLTGGVHVAAEVSRQLTPDAFDADSELRPCGLVTMASDGPDGPTAIAGRMLVNVWLYHATSDAANATAVARVRTLLHRTVLPGTYEARWVFDAPPFEEDALRARGAVTRYEVIRRLAG